MSSGGSMAITGVSLFRIIGYKCSNLEYSESKVGVDLCKMSKKRP